MSKDQKKTVKIPVKIVNNLQEKIGWISSTITIWHFEKVWPMNLIQDVCDNIYDELNYDTLKDFNYVSFSHIIDK